MPSGMRRDGMRLLGAVLAGGRSSRFGSDKALAMLDGRTLLDHAAAALGAHVETVVICGRHVPGMTGLADRPAADMGPLGGLNAALHQDRKSVGEGKSVSVRVDLGGRRHIKKK